METVQLPQTVGSLIIIDPTNNSDQLKIFRRNDLAVNEDYPQRAAKCFETGHANGYDLYTEEEVGQLADEYGFIVLDMSALEGLL